MLARKTRNEIITVAGEFNHEPAALLAVAEVESGGSAFATVDGKSEPLIRFEGHYFDRRLSDADRQRARDAGLASPTAGAIRNPATQAARWRLLEQAAAIDRKAAHESVSWGLGQVMGSHWAWLGFADVDALVAEARSGAAGQARLMARYIDKAGLSTALRNRDWEAFARGYNGPGYKRNAYPEKLAAAHARHAGAAPGDQPKSIEAASVLLARGAAGEDVRTLQRALSALGYPLTADGAFGAATEAAVKTFQADHGLTADGIFGPKTSAAMDRAMPFGNRDGGWWESLLGWLARLFGGG